MNEAQINATTNPAAGPTQAAEREDRRVLRLVLFDALASEAMGTLTTGVFLVGFAVALGADNFAIGVLAAVPFGHRQPTMNDLPPSLREEEKSGSDARPTQDPQAGSADVGQSDRQNGRRRTPRVEPNNGVPRICDPC
jgi:hypothetical protein